LTNGSFANNPPEGIGADLRNEVYHDHPPKDLDAELRSLRAWCVGHYIWYRFSGYTEIPPNSNIEVHKIFDVSFEETPGGSEDGLVFCLSHGNRYTRTIESWADCEHGPSPPPDRPLCTLCFPGSERSRGASVSALTPGAPQG